MRPGIRWIAYWLVVVGCFAFVGYVFVDGRRAPTGVNTSTVAAPRSTLAGPQSTASPSASPTPSAGPTTALFVGDSYAAGTDGVARRSTLARLVCARLKWSCRYDAVRGSGYLAGPSYSSRLAGDDDDGEAPDVVVVTSGRADLDLAGVQKAANSYLDDVAERFPDAAVLVVEPFWNDDLASTAVTQLRAAVRAGVRDTDATWVPSQGWVQTSMLLPGGLQLTADGHKRLARQLADKLRTALPEP